MMAASSDRRTRRSMEFQQGYEATFDPPLEVKYVCPICLAALREAVQTTCGHRFCKGCLATLINGQTHLKCPVDKKWLIPDVQIFPDVAIRREVLSLYVRCHNHAQGCPWIGELRELEFHDEVCGFILTPCSNECGEMVCTDMLDTHNQICPKRLIVCQHCQTQVVFSEMTKHQVLICKKFPVKCTLCGKMGINREDIPKHVDSSVGDCPQAMVLCQFAKIGCTAKEPRQQLANHYEEQAHLHLQLVMASSEQRFEMMAQKINALSYNLDLLQRMSGANSGKHLHVQDGLQTGGNVYWRLDLREGSEGRHICPPFYTGFPGYKLCVSLDLESPRTVRDNGEAPYTYLCVQLQEGEFDSSLTFPVSGLCRVTLFDQSEGAVPENNHTVSLSCTGLKPSEYGENSVLSTRFLPHSEILKYCRDLVLYFELSVTPLLVNPQAEFEN